MKTSPSKVALVKCDSYEQYAIKEAVTKAVELLGGIGLFVSSKQNVLIKPNMLSPQPPERAITTHPAVVEAVIDLVKSAGAIVSIGDSPGFYKFSSSAKTSGISQVAERTGVRLTPFDEEEQIATAEGCFTKRLTVARAVVKADAVISIPKFKTHDITYITGAIKNLFGCIPGLKKSEMHLRFPDNEQFSRMLVDIALSVPVRLHIVDAIIGMDGNGPSAGDPFKIGLIIAGTDPVAVDSVACRVVGIDPATIPMIRIGEECKLGVAAENGIEIVGESVESARVKGFRHIQHRVEAGRLLPLPQSLLKRLQRWIVRRPRINNNLCTVCGACMEICPVRPKALSIRHGRVVISDESCILCYCCNEICPSRAVNLKRGFAAGLMARLLRFE